ncbi:MAG: hypothetical protein E7Y34_01845 [Mycoplasma sp.]|nr:hypothetical protein [Mycoplasma sp.]
MPKNLYRDKVKQKNPQENLAEIINIFKDQKTLFLMKSITTIVQRIKSAKSNMQKLCLAFQAIEVILNCADKD